jgi:hypothetical protein
MLLEDIEKLFHPAGASDKAGASPKYVSVETPVHQA